MTFPGASLPMVARARSHDDEIRQLALATIIALFWKPVYIRLRLKWRFDAAAAAAITHEFFAVVLERDVIARYDPVRGRLREFLRGWADETAADARRAGVDVHASRRVTLVPFDFAAAERELAGLHGEAALDFDEVFYRGSVRSLFDRALARLRTVAEANGQMVMFDVFLRYDFPEEGAPRATYAAVGREFGLRPATVTSHLASMRRQLRQLVLEQLRDLTSSDDEYEIEARRLYGEVS